MTITCAIIDDEPLAAGLLKSYVEKTPSSNSSDPTVVPLRQ